MNDDVEILVPRVAAGDDAVTVQRWLVEDGARVEAGLEVADIGTTKATVAIAAPTAGYIRRECREGARVAVGDMIGRITRSPQGVNEQAQEQAATSSQTDPVDGPVVSDAARTLMQAHGIDPETFAGRATVRSADVETWIGIGTLRGQLHELRRTLDAKHQRHVPLGTLLHDRWHLAAERGFGEGTSVYDECLILGDVTVGAHCWIGPFTVLDGSRGALRIGDHTQISTGSQIYTHHSIAQCLTGGLAPLFSADTTIGRCCYIAPHVVIVAGTVLGDHCAVAAGSLVDGQFPAYSFIAGSPAARIGRVEIDGDRVRLVREDP